MSSCRQELCPNWSGDGNVCPCVIFELPREQGRYMSDVVAVVDGIMLDWEVTRRYRREFDKAAVIELADTLRCDPTAESIHMSLDSGDWRATDTMIELAQDRFWVDTDEAEVTDVTALADV